MKRQFEVSCNVTAVVTVDDSLIKEAMSAKWQKDFYKFENAEEVVEHLAYNLLRGNALPSLDGFAHRDSTDATTSNEMWIFEVTDCDPPPPAKRRRRVG